jgi:hypothetical protein
MNSLISGLIVYCAFLAQRRLDVGEQVVPVLRRLFLQLRRPELT